MNNDEPKVQTKSSAASGGAIAGWALTGSGAAALGWAAFRLNERAKLSAALASNVRVQTLQKAYKIAGAAPPQYQWILDGSWDDRAASALPMLSTLTAEAGLKAVLATLPKPDAAASAIDMVRDQLKAMGIEIPAAVDEAIDVLDKAWSSKAQSKQRP